MEASALSVRSQMAAASRHIGRLKRIDRAAVVLITLGGIAVVVAVIGILVFVAAEAMPLFRSAQLTADGHVPIQSALTMKESASFRGAGVDEYRKYLYTVEPAGVVAFHRVDTGGRGTDAPIPALNGASVTSSSRSMTGHQVAAGLSDGRVALLQVLFTPQYEGETLKDLTIDVRDRGAVVLDAAKRPVRQVAYLDQEGSRYVAGIVSDGEVLFRWKEGEGEDKSAPLKVDAPQRATQVRIGRNGAVLVGTDQGRVYHWELSDVPTLTDVSPVGKGAVTALEWMLGGRSWVAGSEDGSLSGWFRAAPPGQPEAMVQAHTFEPQSAPVVSIALSSRERSFATVGRDGEIVLRHQTSERVLADLKTTADVAAVVITPKADGLLTVERGVLQRFQLFNPHPEASLKTLFQKVWYEGYATPAYVWQSTGATDDFEAKFSLIPLIFGTMKGTFYAMLFAVPLAVLAALYTSQFTDPIIRAKIKPVVEIMAALPSVVIGFLAGLYLASLVERNLVTVLIMVPVMLLAGTSGIHLWRLLPVRWTGTLRAGTEVLLILPLLLVGAWVASLVAPTVEALVFGGDVRAWLQAVGLPYDQRNCLVVGIAMGFAVIPIIFTISEDAFSGVPSNLTAASLALGATRWQTAVRVVLPTASPGVFSAVMVGFGRAVGETMIVLMATGNTPVMEWSIFNGIRTLSANIAVEIPEAPSGGTLYRILFLAAALLFVMTFLVNTIAEVIRQRLRDRYKAA